MIHTNSLAETAADIQYGTLSVEEYLKQLQTRVDTVEPEVQALLPEADRWERLHTEALEAESTTPTATQPLHGIPVGVKDIIHVDGFETQANSSVPSEELTGPEAPVVTKLRAAGALIIGKTVTTEFAYWEPGPTRNPHDIAHTPGGSSSGSAAAVAAGLCPLALGTQTIGSIIRPASFCGVVGFKPSYGRIPTEGVIPLSRSVDHVGFFTQEVAGTALASSVLCADWQPFPTSSGLPTIGIPEGPYLQQASPVGLERFRAQCSRLTDVGYEVEAVSLLSDIEQINDVHEQLMAAEAAIAHYEWYQKYDESYAGQTAELVEDGYKVPTKRIASGRASRIDLRKQLTDLMDKHNLDLWMAPGACGPAPEGIDSTGDPVMNLPWTHAGLPTLGIPTGDTVDGLPIGIQCITRFNEDELLLNWGQTIARDVRA